jgi:hypothetical protein
MGVTDVGGTVDGRCAGSMSGAASTGRGRTESIPGVPQCPRTSLHLWEIGGRRLARLTSLATRGKTPTALLTSAKERTGGL